MQDSAANAEFTIERSFNAPRDIVWKAWTEEAALAKWWGPKGCTLRVVAFDLRPGGIFHYAMEFQPGHAMFGRFEYREIVAPERIAFVSSFADADGGVTRAPFSDTWPLRVFNTLTLEAKGATTRVALRGGPIDATDAERASFAGMFASMRQGFGGTFDQLDAYLATS